VNRVRGWAQVVAGMVDGQEVASHPSVGDDGWCGRGWGPNGGASVVIITRTKTREGWWGERGANIVAYCFSRPYMSFFWFAGLAAAHVVGTGSFLDMSWGRILAGATVVVFADAVAMRPAVASIIAMCGRVGSVGTISLKGFDCGLQLRVLAVELVNFCCERGELLSQILQDRSAGGVRGGKIREGLSGRSDGLLGCRIVACLVCCCGLFVQFLLGVEEMRFEVGPGFVSVRFATPFANCIMIKTCLIDQMPSGCKDLSVREGLVSGRGDVATILDWFDQQFKRSVSVPGFVKVHRILGSARRRNLSIRRKQMGENCQDREIVVPSVWVF
jgi:hypothetical protein